jgi:hypothetical protein
MGAVVFSDVHADAGALERFISCIASSRFAEHFGPVDCLVNLGDLLHRGYQPRETLEIFRALTDRYQVISLIGNHDHAFLNRLPVSGNDARAMLAHEEIRNSPLLSVFKGMPDAWQHDGMLFVHGGPLDRDGSWLDMKFWQRLSRWPGPTISGYHYTPEMAFEYLGKRGIRHLCCGHQHQRACCRKTGEGIVEYSIDPEPLKSWDGGMRLAAAAIPLDHPTIIRLGACRGDRPEFGYTDFSRFSIIEMSGPV